MKVIDKLNLKQQSMENNPSVTIAFIGDSVTQGCFEIYFETETKMETVFEGKNSYPSRLKEMLGMLYPNAQVNIINSGISGDNVFGGLKRLERDVLRFSPDLVVIGYGLNDCLHGGENKVDEFAAALGEMAKKVSDTGAELICISQGPYCTKMSPHVTDGRFKPYIDRLCELENNGTLKAYYNAYGEMAKKYGARVCDVYSSWERLKNGGVNTTDLLANKMNHPIREFHYYMAIKLLETLFEV